MLYRRSPFSQLRAILLRHPSAIITGTVLLTVIMLALFATVIMQARTAAADRAAETSANLALVIERDVTRTFQYTDLSLQAFSQRVLDPEIMRMPTYYRHQALFDRATTTGKYLGAMLYVNEHGKIVEDSGAGQPRSGAFDDRSWFQAHKDNPNVGLYISAPFYSRLRGDDPSLGLSRRVNHADGSFAGVVVAAIRLEYFRHLMSGIELGAHGSVALMRPDGTLVMRFPANGSVIGRSLKGTDNFDHFAATGEKTFFGSGGTDGERRLYVFRKFAEFPMLVRVAPGVKDIYASWQRHSLYIAIFVLLLAGALVTMAVFLSLEFRHRLKIETDLRLLSRTDSLTGLNNRRTLDGSLKYEWNRMKRSKRPMSVLFIDIDRFKMFNDTYGHQAGDDALTAVAQAIAGCVQRPSDTAARFGGEEFVVILPETGATGALSIATAVHQAVRALQIEHAGSEHRTMTVSIGVATSGDMAIVSADDLMHAADKALYSAKQAGRNTTVVAADEEK
ncbi:MAG: hypothetical protein JWQ21_3589 [Herminiimonas sp.]|nr:hypothetical protein [Herminiimonas sp.]